MESTELELAQAKATVDAMNRHSVEYWQKVGPIDVQSLQEHAKTKVASAIAKRTKALLLSDTKLLEAVNIAYNLDYWRAVAKVNHQKEPSAEGADLLNQWAIESARKLANA